MISLPTPPRLLAASAVMAAQAFAPWPSPAATPTQRAAMLGALPAIEQRMSERMRALRLPGLAVGIVVDGELVWTSARGVRDAASGEPVERDTIFRIASMTKSFTAAAILVLRDDGRLSLEDPVSRFVPELGQLARATGDSAPLTVRQLLSHSAGLPEDNPWGDRQLAQSEETFSAWLRSGVPFSTPPNTAYEYSNYAFAILGRIVTRASGLPYQDFIRQRLLDPLGMRSTFWDAASVPPTRRASGHRLAGEGYEVETPLGDGAFGAMGGLWTSTDDLARWVAFMLSAWPPRDEADRGPLARHSLREMQQAARASDLEVDLGRGDGRLRASAGGYGFGLRVERDCRFAHMVSHGGGLPGFGSHMRWLPEYGVGVIAMANLTYAPAGLLTREVIEMLDAAGALVARPVTPSPALVSMHSQVGRLIDRWDDELARGIAADNLYLDRPLDEWRRLVVAARDGLGSCRTGAILPENALRGRFRLDCERGWIDAFFTLAPTAPPKVQELDVTPGRPLSPRLSRAIDELARSVAEGTDAVGGATLGVRALDARLLPIRARYGTCRVGETLSGNGESAATVRFACKSGSVDVRVAFDPAAGRFTEVSFARPPGAACVP